MRGGIVWSPLGPLTGELAEVWEETRTEKATGTGKNLRVQLPYFHLDRMM